MGEVEQAPLFVGVPTQQAVVADRKRREEFLTPRPVVRVTLPRAIKVFRYGNHVVVMVAGRVVYDSVDDGHRPLRVLDICAGYGVWASELRRYLAEFGVDVDITGIEIHAEKLVHLRKWCDEVLIVDWRVGVVGRSWDIVLGNPAFTLARAPDNGESPKRRVYYPERSMVAEVLRGSRSLLLYGTQQSWTKTPAGYLVRQKYPPAIVLDLPGSVSHQGPGRGSDSVPYSTLVWLPGYDGPTRVRLLPALGPGENGWITPPGMESPDEAGLAGLPLAPAYKEAA